MKNLWSYCGLVDAKIRASDKDLPVTESWAFVLGLARKTIEFLKTLPQLTPRDLKTGKVSTW